MLGKSDFGDKFLALPLIPEALNKLGQSKGCCHFGKYASFSLTDGFPLVAMCTKADKGRGPSDPASLSPTSTFSDGGKFCFGGTVV
ncbi:hypothetical protein T11_16924 [Trichinella zimbabwensis]|uniref:Uncharacterized protein n=1 Tax=Trichinella zimbabwensis TaxID=268475 RepID=A0A0V1HPF6_9BILA|nr:hypothetical protein T11_16924 [Trichinella zimbabwensis]